MFTFVLGALSAVGEVLLQKLATSPDLAGITHVVVDEVHERSLDSDFLLALLRKLLRSNRALRVVLMSATANPELFMNYFRASALTPTAAAFVRFSFFGILHRFFHDRSHFARKTKRVVMTVDSWFAKLIA